MSEEDNFTKARLESIKASKHDIKTQKNENKREFIDKYIKLKFGHDEGIEKVARTYILLKRGINPCSCPSMKIEISDKQINDIFKEIKQESAKKFISFYESYLRKIEKKYSEEYVLSAIQDLKTAYHTFRKSTQLNWDCPDERITLSEMQNLYLLLTERKGIEGEKTYEEK